jgi:hypothetical protein
MSGCLSEIERLILAQLLVQDLHEIAAVIIGPAIVEADHHIALLRKPLIPPAGAELVVNLLRSGAAVDRENNGIAARPIEGKRLDDAAIDLHTIRCREGKHFRR